MTCVRCPQPAIVIGRLYDAASMAQLYPTLVGECGFCERCLELLKRWCGTKELEQQGAAA